MADTALAQLHRAIKRQWSRAPSKKAQPYVNAFSAAVRTDTKITAKVVGNHGTYTVSIQLGTQGLTSACSCYIGKHGHCHHCEALAITFVQAPSLFKVVTPTQRKDVRGLTDVQAYLQKSRRVVTSITTARATKVNARKNMSARRTLRRNLA
jgi:uncharacterized Zn finger protein